MSAAVSIKSITEIISSANIVQWYDAEDITVGVGNSIATWNDRSSLSNHLTQASNSRKGVLQQDSNGFKYVEFDYSVFDKSMSSTLSTMNYDETAIIIVSKTFDVTRRTLRKDGSGGLDRLDLQNTTVQQLITDSTTGSGRQTLTLDANTLKIYSYSRRSSSNPVMRLSYNASPGQTIPLVNTTFPSASVHSWFDNPSGTTAVFKIYSVLIINQFIDDNTLQNLMRSMAFQKCIPLT